MPERTYNSDYLAQKEIAYVRMLYGFIGIFWVLLQCGTMYIFPIQQWCVLGGIHTIRRIQCSALATIPSAKAFQLARWNDVPSPGPPEPLLSGGWGHAGRGDLLHWWDLLLESCPIFSFKEFRAL